MSECHTDTNLDARLAAMRNPHPDSDCLYHAITLTADENLRVVFGLHSEWVGFDDEDRFEVRQSRLVYADYVKTWEKIGLPYVIVNRADELSLFLIGGGCGLVEKELAERVFPTMVGPRTTVPDGMLGFKGVGMFDESAFRKAPTPKLRMRVLERDGRKCRICGRRPDDSVDLRLHVHHIRPWAKGGVTDPSNLITLCHTCHEGLHPHEDPALFGYLRERESDKVAAYPLTHRKGVLNYRKAGFFAEPKQAKVRNRSRRKTKDLGKSKSAV